jgi:hypothetical protein
VSGVVVKKKNYYFIFYFYFIMDSQITVVYELSDPLSGEELITHSRNKAKVYFENGWIVHENHISRFKPSEYTMTTTTVAFLWNNNPDFEGDQL